MPFLHVNALADNSGSGQRRWDWEAGQGRWISFIWGVVSLECTQPPLSSTMAPICVASLWQSSELWRGSQCKTRVGGWLLLSVPANDVSGTGCESHWLSGCSPRGAWSYDPLDKTIKLCITGGEISLGRMRAFSKGFIFLTYLCNSYVALIMCQAVFKTFYKY